MIRDRGPIFQLGHGVTSRDLPYDEAETEGPNPESGAISKALSHHPVMRFFATAGTTIAGMAIAGAVVRRGGINLAFKLQEVEKPWITNLIKNYRDVQKHLDQWEGVERIFKDGSDSYEKSKKLFVKNQHTGKIEGDTLRDRSGYFFTKEEIEKGRHVPGHMGESLPEWTYKDQIQKNLVRAARRMPYELPAAYFAQRGLTDTLFGGSDESRFQGHWYNPADVLTDFVRSSVKTMATAVGPFEIGGAVASQSLNKFMSLGDEFTHMKAGPRKRRAEQGLILQNVMERVGHDAADMLNKVAKFSSQSVGAFSAGINEARLKAYPFMSMLYDTRHGAKAAEIAAEKNVFKKAITAWDNKFFDALPGPFKGAYSGYHVGKARFNEIGQGYKAFEEFLSMGRSAWGKIHEIGSPKDMALRSHLGGTKTDFEELAQMINTQGLGGSSSKAFKGSPFYDMMIQHEYTKLLQKKLVKEGMRKGTAQDFSQMVRVARPNLEGDPTQLTNRFFFGSNRITAGHQNDIFDIIKRKSGKSFDDLKSHEGLLRAVNEADEIFRGKSFQKSMNYRVDQQWSMFEDRIVPSLGSRMLSKTKPQWSSFSGEVDDLHMGFLRRKTAQTTGMRLTNPDGTLVSEHSVNKWLKSQHFDPNDVGDMRAFLTTKGHIAKPWNRGYNVFGLRQLTVSEAGNRGYFDTTAYNEKQVQRLVGKMTANDPIGVGDYTVKGAYVTKSGKVVDVNRIRKGFSAAMRAADDIQAPLVHIPFLQMVGFSAKRDISERSILQMVPGTSRQPFLGRDGIEDDLHIWVRNKGRGSKGKVVSMGVNQQGYLTADMLEGNFRPLAANAKNIASRHIRMAIGDTGMGPVDASVRNSKLRGWLGTNAAGDSRYDRARKFFSVAEDQPDSVFGYLNRLVNRNLDIKNPRVMGALLRDGEVRHGDDIIRLIAGKVEDGSGNLVADEDAMATAFKSWSNRIRRKGFSERTITQVSEGNERIKSAWSYNFERSEVKSFAPGMQDVSKLHGSDQLLEAARIIKSKDIDFAETLDPVNKSIVTKARQALVDRHLEQSSSPEFWNRPLPGNRSGGGAINTRADELKSEMLKYLTIRKGVTEDNFPSLIADITEELSTLKSSYKISASEYTEARAALLSTQVNFKSFASYDAVGASSLTNARTLYNSILGDPQMKGFLDDVASGELSRTSGRFGGIRPTINRKFGAAPHTAEGAEYSPFGQANSVFVPTVGTAFGREGNAWKTAKSVAGIGTWDNPEAFSGMSIPMGHFIERLNKFSSVFGLSLDPTAFKGPIDMYAKGMVGKRALPIVAGGATVLAADRLVGGALNDRDQNGDRVYSPYFLGKAARPLAELQAAAALIPGGQSYDEKREEIFKGEVPVRAGRWWPLGSTPWEGGRIQYYRPSWYRRMKAGHLYQDQTYGNPLEHLAFGYDFSPLRPLDPYRFERQHYEDRPYPESGDYFTGPWGPLTPILNATVGKVLKPRISMHEDEVAQGMATYQPVGQQGMFMPSNSMISGVSAMRNAASGGTGGGLAGAQNARYGSAGGHSPGTASNIVTSDIGAANAKYSNAAGPSGMYGTSANTSNVMRPEIVSAGRPISKSSFQYQMGEFGYKAQEMLGIYGFAFASVRSGLGFGDKDFTPDQAVLANPSGAYGSTRGFWDLNLGGLGDSPLPLEGPHSNIELSEMIRRFIPKERTGIQTINPIANSMGEQYPWLPGSDYFTNFKQGDPYTKVQEGEMRLPGQGYERFNKLHSDSTGKYGVLDQLKILSDVAPWSAEYKSINGVVNSMYLSPAEEQMVQTIRDQVQAKSVKKEFTPYKYKYSSPEEMLKDPFDFGVGRAWEKFAHSDTYFNTKFLHKRTAVEDWERENVYGSTFPQWQNPIEDFIKPIAYKATQRHPVAATLGVGAIGSLFGRTGSMKAVGAVIGGTIGLVSSMYGKGYEAVTGDRFMPAERRKQVALEEYVDILSYTKNMKLAQQAGGSGDDEMAARYRQQAQQTMYGADIYNADIDQLAMAIPKRKREHFRAMINAPEQEREQILSTSGRLERRIYEAAWGRKVESRPDLTSYFKQHELPAENWEGWHPNTNMDDVKIKMAQNMGIELSQLGYYPQEVREANLVNPSYPSFSVPTPRNRMADLRRLMAQRGIRGNVTAAPNPFGGDRVNYNAGVLSGV